MFFPSGNKEIFLTDFHSMRLFTGAIFLFVVTLFPGGIFATSRAGFYLPDSVQETTIPFRMAHNLIVLPVVINDTVQVNLVLDTGCRNLVLFSKNFQKNFIIESQRVVTFSGLGDGRPVNGNLSLGNKVSISAIRGEKIPVVIVSENSLFGKKDHIDGIIGYDIFIKFEIELNIEDHQIKFRPAMHAAVPDGYAAIPLRIEDSKPVIHSTIFFEEDNSYSLDVMIDTGSSLGLLLKTTDVGQYETDGTPKVIGRGLNGMLEGTEIFASKLLFPGFELNRLSTNIVASPWHNYASIGMATLKEYAIIINYCKAYVCLKKFHRDSRVRNNF